MSKKSQINDTVKDHVKGKRTGGGSLEHDLGKYARSIKDDVGIPIDMVPAGTSEKKSLDDHISHLISKEKEHLKRSHQTTKPCPACPTACGKCWKSQRPTQHSKNVLKTRNKSIEKKKSEKPKHVVETGYFKTSKERRFNFTLPSIRQMSYPVLQKQNFDRHTKINTKGFLLNQKLKQFWGLETITEESDIDEDMPENALGTINYVLQLRLDEVIAMPSRPIDGYDEARIGVSRDAHQKLKENSDRRRISRSSSSLSSIPSNITNLKDIKNLKSDGSGVEANLTRSLLYMKTSLLLALLPTLSNEVRFELTHDFEHLLKYSKILEDVFSKKGVHTRRKLKKTTFSSERWLAVIYIDYKRSKPIEAFRRLLVKLILHKYLVAFEEKDLSKVHVTSELHTRLGFYSPEYDVPFVFTNGFPIGGCSMIYYLHNVGLVDKFFKHSIMDPDQYHRWLHNPLENIVREPLLLKVPLASFPLVNDIMKGNVKELGTDMAALYLEDFLLEGAFVVNESQRKWNEILRETKYSEPRILLYVQHKMTIFGVLLMMEHKLAYHYKRKHGFLVRQCCAMT